MDSTSSLLIALYLAYLAKVYGAHVLRVYILLYFYTFLDSVNHDLQLNNSSAFHLASNRRVHLGASLCVHIATLVFCGGSRLSTMKRIGYRAPIVETW